MRKQYEQIREERLKFKSGMQKEFIKQIKQKSGLTWQRLAEFVNLSEHTLRVDWATEVSTVPLSCAKNLLDKVPFESWEIIQSQWVDKVLVKNWGQKKAGGKNKKVLVVPTKSEGLAEVFGVILGDGNLNPKTITITGNLYEKAHHKYISGKIQKLFGLKACTYNSKRCKATNLLINSVEFVKYFRANGFMIGDKIKNKSSLPRWIFEKEEYACGALRGLLDTDGGIYQKQKNYKRAIIEFQTESSDIRCNICELLRKVGFTPSKSDVNVRIQKQEEVRRFLSLVGCANPKNIMRCKYFIETGEIPLKEQIWKEIEGLEVNEPFKATLI
ncbi:MAG: LAGLIDADG family homing endonuclease [archaeon]